MDPKCHWICNFEKKNQTVKYTKLARTKTRRVTTRKKDEPHFSVIKGSKEQDHLEYICNLQEEVIDEFYKADKFAKRVLAPKETTKTGTLPENQKRNRYIDMVPFDSNIVNLQINTGTIVYYRYNVVLHWEPCTGKGPSYERGP